MRASARVGTNSAAPQVNPATTAAAQTRVIQRVFVAIVITHLKVFAWRTETGFTIAVQLARQEPDKRWLRGRAGTG
jgi:hypothetical protein